MRLIQFERVTPGPVPESAIEYMVPIRDGIRLATDVYLPDRDQTPGPTGLTRLPYDKNGDYTFMPLIAEYMAQRGYRPDGLKLFQLPRQVESFR